jgi:adenylate kinase family enzyme
MRIVVVGTSGAGKTTLARIIAARLALPHIELDAINWQPGWRDLIRHDPQEFVSRVTTAAQADSWVFDGNYTAHTTIVWLRATHLVWLDYERRIIMARVIRRSLLRAVLRTRLWAGNRERWRQLLRASHPIRWAWSTWKRRRRETAERLAQPQYARLQVLRLRHPREAPRAVDRLVAAASRVLPEQLESVQHRLDHPPGERNADETPRQHQMQRRRATSARDHPHPPLKPSP